MSTILLIEPSALLRKNYKTALSQAGHTVMACRTGQQAIEAADNKTPDVVIVELQLAGHNGLEFLYEFRSYIEWQTIPVIVLSVVPKAVVEHSAALTLLNVTSYLYKPQTKLIDLLHEVSRSSKKVTA